MKVVNLNAMTEGFGRVPKIKTLDEIAKEVDATRGALNPYTITAQNIIKALMRTFVFPTLQPQVVNSLEMGDNQEYYVHRETTIIGEVGRDYQFQGKFQIPRFETPMGMDAPPGLRMCVGSDELPFFVREDELSTGVGMIDYNVYDNDSFRAFIPQLIKDMSFLRPIMRSEVDRLDSTKEGFRYKKGDIVLIPGQGYGKIGVVAEVVQKEYLARFHSPEYFHTPRIGVNLNELTVDEKPLVNHLTFADHMAELNLNWVDDRLREEFSHGYVGRQRAEGFKRLEKRLSLGAAACLVGRCNYIDDIRDASGRELEIGDEVEDPSVMNEGVLGAVSIIGYDEKCAIVVPHSFDKDEKFPWGNVTELAVPVNELTPLGSLEEIKQGTDLYRRIFADNDVVMGCIREITMSALEDLNTAGLIRFCDLSRYKRLYDDLVESPQVPNELVAPQFVKLLTSKGMDGLERLAEVSGQNMMELATELLAKDIAEATESIRDGIVDYSGFVESLNGLVTEHTEFSSVEALLAMAGPEINLYQMMRDGTYTLVRTAGYRVARSGYVRDRGDRYGHDRTVRTSKESFRRIMFELLKKKEKPTGRDYECFVDMFRDHPSGNNLQDVRASFCAVERLPPEQVLEGSSRKIYGLIHVDYKILRKEATVRYGRDEKFNMTHPGIEPIDADRFVLHPVTDDCQMDFLAEVFKKIGESDVEFKGKKDFFDGLDKLVNGIYEKKREREDADKYSSWKSDRDWKIDKVRRFYDGVNTITNNPEVRDRVVASLLGDKPVLLEAYYDFLYLQQMTMTRDFWFRGHLREKTRYLNQFGYQYSLPSSAFADEFFDALASVDEYHRGFPRKEPSHLTRHNTSYGSHGETDTTLGLVASPTADRMIGSISSQVKKLADGMRRTHAVAFLGTGEE